MGWPSRIPPDLEKALAELEGGRNTVYPQDRWGVIQDWLQRYGVEAPEDLPLHPPVDLADR